MDIDDNSEDAVKVKRTRKVNPYKVYDSFGKCLFTSGQIGKCRDWVRKNAASDVSYSILKEYGTFKRQVIEKTRIIEL